MPRSMLTDDLWKKLSLLMLESGRVYNKPAHRMSIEGILYRMRKDVLGEIFHQTLEPGVRYSVVLIYGLRKVWEVQLIPIGSLGRTFSF